VLQVGDGIARVYRARDAMAGELSSFPRVMGMVLNLEKENVGCVCSAPTARQRRRPGPRRAHRQCPSATR